MFLLASRRRVKSSTCSYILSADPSNMSCSGAAFRGLLNSNILGTQFKVLGRKVPRKTNLKLLPVRSSRRSELAAIIYDQNVLGFNGPRLMKVLLPRPEESNEQVTELQVTGDNDGLVERFHNGNISEMLILANKSPQWSCESQNYILNFHGRVTRASVKNFQIVSESDPDNVIMQFGKVGADIFTMDFRYPLCAIQGFRDSFVKLYIKTSLRVTQARRVETI